MDMVKALLCPPKWDPAEIATGVISGYNPVSPKKCMATPVLFRKQDSDESILTVSTFFPAQEDKRKNMMFKVKDQNLTPTNPKGILEKKVKAVKAFDYDKLERISDYVNETGGLLLLIEEVEESKSFVNNMELFNAVFPHIVDLRCNAPMCPEAPSTSKDSPLLFINFFSINKALEIITSKKMPGFAVELGVCWKRVLEEKHRVEGAIPAHFAASTERRGFIEIDGQVVRPTNSTAPKRCGSLLLEYINEMVSKAKKPQPKTSPAPRPTAEAVKYKKLADMYGVTTTTTSNITTYTTSTMDW